MSQMLLEPDALRAHAQQLGAYASSAQARFDVLRGQVEGLQSGFQGRSAVRYQEWMDQWQQSAQALTVALANLGEALVREAAAVEQLDQDLAGGA